MMPDVLQLRKYPDVFEAELISYIYINFAWWQKITASLAETINLGTKDSSLKLARQKGQNLYIYISPWNRMGLSFSHYIVVLLALTATCLTDDLQF